MSTPISQIDSMDTTAPAPTHFLCDCGHPTQPSGLTTGYAVTQDGQKVCYDCADAMQRAEVADASRATFVGYLGTDAKDITTWTGGMLATVTQYGISRAGWYGSKIYYVQAVAPDGSRWYGRNGGPGMIIQMKRAKVAA